MTETAAPAQPAQEAPKQPAPEPAPKVDDTDWKAEARKWEQRAKDNKTAAEELAALKESQKSEAEKAADRARQAEERAAEAEAKVLRRDIAIEHKLSSEDAALLDALTDQDAMKRLAERLASASSERKANGNVVPKEGTSSQPKADDVREFTRRLFSPGE